VNTDAPWPGLDEAKARVLRIQAKLHRWATDSPDRRFCDLFNLVCDPAFLVVAWDRVRGNRGARTAGVDGVKPRSIGTDGEEFLRELRDDLKARRFTPLAVREGMIPKASGKLRRLGIPTARDRAAQASLKLVLEADFDPCSYGFRPLRRAQDAIEEIRHFSARSYEWILEGDIASCFDEISHPALMDRVRERVADKRVVGLVKAFLIAGILSEDAPSGVPRPAPRRAVSSRRCWPTSPSRSSTSTSPRSGGRPWPATTTANGADAAENPCIAWCATRTTSWCWCRAPRPKPTR
jgi:RNA-directed DNA polymerase